MFLNGKTFSVIQMIYCCVVISLKFNHVIFEEYLDQYRLLINFKYLKSHSAISVRTNNTIPKHT